MSLLALLIAVGSAPTPTPTTVNGDVLGTPAEYGNEGPVKICMREMSVRAESGESIYLKYAGIHSGTLTLVSGEKSVDFDHGEIWKRPKRKGKLISVENGVEIFRTKSDHKLAYLIWVPDLDDNDKPSLKPLIWVSGSLLNGSSSDREILDRIDVKMSGQQDCSRTYSYGWGMLLGDEPLSTQKDK